MTEQHQAVEAAEREKFEAWHTGRHGSGLLVRADNGAYAWDMVNDRWQTWLAAATRPQEVAAGVTDATDYPNLSEITDNPNDVNTLLVPFVDMERILAATPAKAEGDGRDAERFRTLAAVMLDPDGELGTHLMQITMPDSVDAVREAIDAAIAATSGKGEQA